MVTGVNGGRGPTAQRHVVLEILHDIGRVQTPPQRMEHPNVMEQSKSQNFAIPTSHVHQVRVLFDWATHSTHLSVETGGGPLNCTMHVV